MSRLPAILGRLAALFLGCSAAFPVFAHDSSDTSLAIPVGETRPFYIIPKGAYENKDSFYSFDVLPDTSIATVTPVLPFNGFSSNKVVQWSVKGVSVGQTSFQIHWSYPPHEASGSFLVTVQVLKDSVGASNNIQVPTAGDPVDTRTGGLYGVENRDLNLGGPIPLYFERYYDSNLQADGNLSSALGVNRSHNFDMSLKLGSFFNFVQGVNLFATADIVTGRGRIIHFFQASDVAFGFSTGWFQVGSKDVAYQLVQNGTVFRMADPSTQTIYVFDQNTGHLTGIEDRKGNALALAYDGNGRLSTVSDGLGRTLTLSYDGNGHLTGVGDGARSVSFTYDGNSNLITATDANSNVTRFAYNSNQYLTSGTQPLGNVPVSQAIATGTVTAQTQFGGTTMFAYNPSSTVQTDPVGAVTTYNYSPTGQLVSMVDAAGKTISMTSDDAGRRNSVTDRLGRTTTAVYDPTSGLPVSVTAGSGTETTSYTAKTDSNGLVFYDVTKITLRDGSTEIFTRDSHGNVLTATDVLGHQTKFTYNSRGQPLTITNALGGVTTFTYDAAARLQTVQDSDTQPTTFTYDASGRISRMTHADGTHRDFTYSNTDRYTIITDERGNSATFTYDADDRLTMVQDALLHTATTGFSMSDQRVSFTNRRGNTTHIGRDARGLVVSGTDALGDTVSSSYNLLRRLTTRTDPTGIAAAFAYDNEGGLTSVAEASGTTTYMRDNRGAISAIINPLQQVTTFERNFLLHQSVVTDPLGRQVIEITDKAGHLVAAKRDGIPGATYTRDALGDVTAIKSPGGGTWKFTYTGMGRLKSETDPLGHKSVYSYDSGGRVTMLTHPDGGTVAVNYDGASLITSATASDGTVLNFTHDADGRLTGATTGSGTDANVALTLDEDGAIVNSAENGHNWSATYDAAGRLASAGYDGGFTVNYTYDSAGRLLAVRDTMTSGTVALSYDNAGRLQTITRPNGVNSTYTFDAANRLTQIQHGGNLVSLSYTLDPAGTVASCQTIAPILPSAAPSSKLFKFNTAGEILSASGTGAPPSAGAFTYDARGRLATSPSYQFSWDGFSRLTAVTDPNSSGNGRQFTYNAFGGVVTRSFIPTGSVTGRTRFYYNFAVGRQAIVAEYDDIGGAFLRYYVYTPDGYLLYSIDAASHSVQYYHPDRNGNVLALTGSDGATTSAYAYGPYGEMLGETGTSTQPFRWLGAFGVRTDVVSRDGVEDPASVLYHTGARWLDPATARYLSRDPTRPQLGEVRSLDPYQYAYGDPATFVDIAGTEPRPPQVVVKTRRIQISGDAARALGFELTAEISQPQLIAQPERIDPAPVHETIPLETLGLTARAPLCCDPCDPCCDPCDPCCDPCDSCDPCDPCTYGPSIVRLQNLVNFMNGWNSNLTSEGFLRNSNGFDFKFVTLEPLTFQNFLISVGLPLYGSSGSSFVSGMLNAPSLSTKAGTAATFENPAR